MISGELLDKLSVGKGQIRPIVVKKSTLFEQKVDLKPKTLGFRAFGIFADR